jgi:NCS1 family nucleobase:cation symporter-1
MGAIGGIMICDYWVLRKGRLRLAEMFNPNGIYSYTSGFNIRALIALFLAIAPVVYGFIRAATTEGGVVADPGFFDILYSYAFFVTFGLGFFIYWLLMRKRIAKDLLGTYDAVSGAAGVITDV